MDGILDAKFEERQMIRRAEMWTHIAAIRSLHRKVHATSTPATLAGCLGEDRSSQP